MDASVVRSWVTFSMGVKFPVNTYILKKIRTGGTVCHLLWKGMGKIALLVTPVLFNLCLKLEQKVLKNDN